MGETILAGAEVHRKKERMRGTTTYTMVAGTRHFIPWGATNARFGQFPCPNSVKHILPCFHRLLSKPASSRAAVPVARSWTHSWEVVRQHLWPANSNETMSVSNAFRTIAVWPNDVWQKNVSRRYSNRPNLTWVPSIVQISSVPHWFAGRLLRQPSPLRLCRTCHPQ